MSEALKPCHKCGRNVKIRQEWRFNKTRLAISWNTMEQLLKEAKEREDENELV